MIGVFGLALAAIGTFGLQSYLVSQRRREIGVRLTLGAAPNRVVWDIWVQAMRSVAFATLVGVVAAMAVSRLLTHAVVAVNPFDPVAITAAVALLLIVAAIANFLPARSAAVLDPTLSLRDDR